MIIRSYFALRIITTLAILSAFGGYFGVKTAFAASASFYISPASGSYTVGDTITASLNVDSGGSAINAGEGSVSYPTDTLEFQSVSTSNSIFTFWTSGPISGSSQASFGGGLSNPGYTGSAGKVLTITWKAKSAGVATISVSGSKILANDGVGTNVYGSSNGASFIVDVASSTSTPIVTVPTVKKPTTSITVNSSTHLDQKKWYAAKDVAISWKGSSDITKYKFSFDQNASGDPASSGSAPSTKSSYKGVADGIWYFHIRGITTTSSTSVTHFQVQIDTTPPDFFEITTVRKGGSIDPAPIVSFEANDKLSGISHYEAKIDNGNYYPIKSGEILSKQRPGDHTVTIRAIDNAGNYTESTSRYQIDGIEPPIIYESTKFVGILDHLFFTGQSQSDDTIIVYLADKEIDRFIAKDKQIAYNRFPKSIFTRAQNNEVVWQYSYKQLLLPGNHVFAFSRVTAAGVESGLTQTYHVRVEAKTVKLGNVVTKTSYVITGILVVVLCLLLLVLYLLIKLHALARLMIPSIGIVANQFKQMFTKTERKIDQEIDETLPNTDLSKASIKTLKNDLKQKIHNTVADEIDELKN